MRVLNEIANDLAGVQLLHDWLGTGATPVPQELAEKRADVCRRCTENVEPRWWDKVKLHVAEVIKAELRIKSGMKVRVRDEDDLHMCKVCGCCVQLKVHAPIKHIKAHTPADKVFPIWCWIRKESE